MSTDRASFWSGTQFNLKAFEDQQNAAAQRGWSVTGQLEECPKTKRQHYQFAVKTGQVRMSQVRKVFPGAHIESARKPAALLQYVEKEDTRVGQLPETSSMYPNLAQLWKLMLEYMITDKYFIVEGDTIVVNERQPWTKCTQLEWFDEFVHISIQDGYHIETLAVNPQTRSCWKLYASSIIVRELASKRKSLQDRQTDRQVEFSSNDDIIPDGKDEGNDTEGDRSQEEDGEEDCPEYGSDDSPSDSEDTFGNEFSEEGETDSEQD
jgi:hypothetical protein